jgi:hypothetical protein
MSVGSYFASIAGNQVVTGSLLIPNVGIWTADLLLATSQGLSGVVAVTIGNLNLSGFVYRVAEYGGQTRVRLVGGSGGWRTPVDAQGYGSSSGVKLSSVLHDVASACGETVKLPKDTSVGPAFVRAADIASDVLWQAYNQGFIPGWYIDPNGVTQCAVWPTVQVGTPFTVTDQRPEDGVVVVATEDYVSWLPGSQFSSPQLQGTYTNVGVHYIWGNDGKFRFEVLTGKSVEDRLVGALNKIIDRKISPLKYHGRYLYQISNPTTSTIDGDPVNQASGMPSLQNVPLLGDSISTYTPPNGGQCHIMFLDGEPTQPVCVWTQGAPTMAQLLSGSNPVARLGDQVQVFLPPTLPISGVVTPLGPFTGIITVVNPISGSITQGSSTVSSA